MVQKYDRNSKEYKAIYMNIYRKMKRKEQRQKVKLMGYEFI